MTSLDLVDGRHEELVAALHSLSTKLAAARLLAHLRDLPPLQEAPQTLFYHVDTTRRLCALILEPSPISGHIGFLRDLLDTLVSYSTGPAAPRVQTLQPALARLRLLLAAEFAVRGQWPEVCAVLPDAAPPAAGQLDLAPFLAGLAERAKASGLQWPFHLRDPATCVGKGSVLTVLVDSPAVPEAHREAYLTLLSVKVAIHKRRGDEPHVVRSRDDSGEDLPLGDDLKDLVREALDHALRLLGPHIARRAVRHRFEIELSLRRPEPVATVQGRSILLPLVLVLAEQLSEQLNLPFAFLPNRSLVWTGDVDEHGKLATIGDIDRKAVRVAASRVDGLAFPAIDQPTVDSARLDTPSQSLTVHGITTLADVTAQPELVSTPSRSLPTRAVFSLQRKTRPLGLTGTAVLAFLLLAFGFAAPRLMPLLDRRVVDAEFTEDKQHVRLLNAADRTVRTLQVEHSTQRYPILEDVDGDDVPELFVASNTDDPLPGRLFCYDLKGRERWRFAGGFQPEEPPPYPVGNTFSCIGVFARDLTRDGEKEVIAVFAHAPSCPSQVALLSPEGEYRSSFWHLGYPAPNRFSTRQDCAAFADIDGDDLDEILITATSNSCSTGVLIVLDPRSIMGKGPRCGESDSLPSWQGYVVFPRFAALRELLLAPRFDCTSPSIGTWNDRQAIRVEMRAESPGYGPLGFFTYQLGFDLDLVDCYYPDPMPLTVDEIAAKRGLSFDMRTPEFKTEMEQIRIIPGDPALLRP